MAVFKGTKYEKASSEALAFIKRQLDVNNFKCQISFAKEYAESLAQTTGMIACITDHDQVVAASGQGSRELMGKAISKELDRVITEREMKCYHTGERKILPLVENQKESSSELIVQPIICSGDAIGSVALVGKSAGERFGNSEQMLVKTAAGFLGRQMEQ